MGDSRKLNMNSTGPSRTQMAKLLASLTELRNTQIKNGQESYMDGSAIQPAKNYLILRDTPNSNPTMTSTRRPKLHTYILTWL